MERPPKVEHSSHVEQSSKGVGYVLGCFVFKLLGWRLKGDLPKLNKFVISVAPHTSNWDFVVGVSVLLKLGIKLSFLGKHSIFIWPFSLLLKKIGGIPVERSSAHGVVQQIVSEFDKRDNMILALAPEGTRSKVERWKTGFIQIANQAECPVVPVGLNFKDKEVVFGQPIFMSGNIEDDLLTVQSFYQKDWAKNPQLY